ncbi:YciI family protein [Longimicrobium sp.]|uniref:YciI family protein n=1 Tax=Longimicrobium sp. TaxID=2029185 RepID=UPI002E2F313A|nr:YciI family protein [Longimicrobium sp.]HEX6038993.1 YciI family protein [Longimicrobium sp.]
MRFLVIRKADEETEAGVMPSEQLVADMAAYVQALVDAGIMRSGDGLKPSAQGARLQFSNGTPTVTDGPFTETKELVAGLSVWECASLDEAVAWARRWPVIDGHGNVALEIRPFYEVEDFGEGAGVDHHVRLREQMAGA